MSRRAGAPEAVAERGAAGPVVAVAEAEGAAAGAEAVPARPVVAGTGRWLERGRR